MEEQKTAESHQLSNDQCERRSESPSVSRKRTRTTLTQLRVLEERFAEMPSPDSKLRRQLSEELGMSERSIQIWFQNRRAKVKLMKKRSKMKEQAQSLPAMAKKDNSATTSLPPVIKRSPLVDRSALYPTSHPAKPNVPRSVAARMPYNRAWSYDMAKERSPVVFSPAAHALPYWNYPYYPMGPPPAFPPTHIPQHYARPMYHSRIDAAADKQLAADMASLAFSDMMQSQLRQQSHPMYHQPPPASHHLIRYKQSSSLPPQDYRHGSQFSSSPISDMTDESGKRYDLASMEPPIAALSPVGYLLANTITIGTWHRICIREDDLQLEYDMNDRLFSWHIRTEDYHFKMDLGFDMISNIDYQPSQVTPGVAEICIDIQDLPHFYMDMGADGWLRCGDFTENAQATQLRQHVISGEASQLRVQVLQLAALDQSLSNKIHMIEEEDDQQPFASLVNFDWINDEDASNMAGVHRYSSMPILGNPGEDLSWP